MSTCLPSVFGQLRLSEIHERLQSRDLQVGLRAARQLAISLLLSLETRPTLPEHPTVLVNLLPHTNASAWLQSCRGEK